MCRIERINKNMVLDIVKIEKSFEKITSKMLMNLDDTGLGVITQLNTISKDLEIIQYINIR